MEKLPSCNGSTPPTINHSNGSKSAKCRKVLLKARSSNGHSALPPNPEKFSTSAPLFKGHGIHADESSQHDIPEITQRGLEYGLVTKSGRHQSDIGRVPQPPMTPPEIFSLPKIPLTSDGQGYDATAWIRANRDIVKQIYAKHAADYHNSTSKMEWSTSDKGYEKLPQIVQPENRSLPVVLNRPDWF